MTISPDNPILDGIDLRRVTAYLGSTGWRRRTDFPRQDLVVFEGPLDDDGEPIPAVLPAMGDERAFREKLARLIDALSVIERRDARDIVLDMRAPGVDRLFARLLSDAAASGGSIPLSFAATVVQGLRDLVAAAACAEEKPGPFFTKTTKIGSEHARSWRFGQTQPGSFVFSIECPVAQTADQRLPPDAAPFARRVSERIMRGLGRLDRAGLDGSADQLFKGYQDGLNANMCEALLPLQSPGLDLQIEFSIHWSRWLPAPTDIPRRALLERRGFELLDATAKALRTPTASSERSFTGEIVKLQRESEEDRVAVLRFVADGRRIQAKMSLEVEDYRLACHAHLEGAPVALQGRLERVGHKQWQIFGIRDFRFDAAFELETTETRGRSHEH